MIEFMSGNVRKEFEAIEDRIRENRLSDEELDIQNKRKKKVLIAKIWVTVVLPFDPVGVVNV